MRFFYSQQAVADLKLFPRTVARRIALKIEWYLSQKSPLQFTKKLNPPFEYLYRFRIGEYRAIFEIINKKEIAVLYILRVKHRKNIYE